MWKVQWLAQNHCYLRGRKQFLREEMILMLLPPQHTCSSNPQFILVTGNLLPFPYLGLMLLNGHSAVS